MVKGDFLKATAGKKKKKTTEVSPSSVSAKLTVSTDEGKPPAQIEEGQQISTLSESRTNSSPNAKQDMQKSQARKESDSMEAIADSTQRPTELLRKLMAIITEPAQGRTTRIARRQRKTASKGEQGTVKLALQDLAAVLPGAERQKGRLSIMEAQLRERQTSYRRKVYGYHYDVPSGEASPSEKVLPSVRVLPSGRLLRIGEVLPDRRELPSERVVRIGIGLIGPSERVLRIGRGGPSKKVLRIGNVSASKEESRVPSLVPDESVSDLA